MYKMKIKFKKMAFYIWYSSIFHETQIYSGAVKLDFYSAHLKLKYELIRYFEELKCVQIIWD